MLTDTIMSLAEAGVGDALELPAEPAAGEGVQAGDGDGEGVQVGVGDGLGEGVSCNPPDTREGERECRVCFAGMPC